MFFSNFCGVQIGKSLNVKDEEEKKGLKLLAEWIERGEAKNILVLCGAGVSVSAGEKVFIHADLSPTTVT